VIVAAFTTAVSAAPGVAGAHGWSRPFQIAAPVGSDLIPAELAFSATGAPAIAYGTFDEDRPDVSSAFARLAPKGRSGRFSPAYRVPSAQQVLAVAPDGGAFDLVTGTSPRGLACCSTAQFLQLTSAGAFRRRRTLVHGLAGATEARLVSLRKGGGMLAAVGTERGVWVTQTSGAHGGWSRTGRLSAAGTFTQAIDATTFATGRTIVAWTASAPGHPFPAAAQEIDFATGTGAAAPRVRRVAATVPAGYAIDGLALADGGRSPTAAWLESWYDSSGAYHSQLLAVDVGTGSAPVPVSSAGGLGTSVSLAADAHGDEVLAWRECDTTGACVADGALRRAGRAWSPPRRLGTVDPTDTPVAAESAAGVALVGWVSSGHVVAASAGPRAGAFRTGHVVSATNYAADLTLAFSPAAGGGGGALALAAWTQGTLNEAVMGARFAP
jgi:hypothetical protein